MQIPPKYYLTSEIIDLLTKIEANRLHINSLQISGPIRNRIERVSLLKSSLFSARIEGNPLTLDEIETTTDDVRKKEVKNILRAITYINTQIKPGDTITSKTLQQVHRLVIESLSPKAGRWRSEVSGIFNQVGVAVYLPPPPAEVSDLVNSLVDFVNSKKEANSLVCALIAHLVFEKIHPFLDGNGRVGRLLMLVINHSRDWTFPVLVPVEEYIDEHKEGYYYHLDRGYQDIAGYLTYMLEAFLASTERLRIEITELINKTPLPVSPRQEEIYQIVKDHRTTSFDFIRRRFLKVPERTLRYDLKKLIDKKLLRKIGQTRGTYYQVIE